MSKLSEVIASAEPDRNWDEETQAQQRQIEDEVAKSQALIGAKVSLSTLGSEYNENESSDFLQKAKELCTKYSDWRRVRGDGNCFYRAIAFAQCERLLLMRSTDRAYCQRFRDSAAGWKERLLKLGYPTMTTEDFCETFVEILDRLSQEDFTLDQLINVFNSGGESDYIVVFMRLVTGGFLIENEEQYAGFVDGFRTIKQYVEQDVNPMYRECDHLCITALTKALEIPVRVEYMDRTKAPAGGWSHEFLVDNDDINAATRITFLYRPGHYDILYPIPENAAVL